MIKFSGSVIQRGLECRRARARGAQRGRRGYFNTGNKARHGGALPVAFPVAHRILGS